MQRARGDDKCVQNFGGKPEVKKPLGRPGHIWKDNIKIYLREMGLGVRIGGGLL
jgi:hypothetical protein